MSLKSRWWLLYAIFPLSAGLLWLDGRLALPPREHQLFEMGIVLISFGLMALWVHANQSAVAKESVPHNVYSPPLDPECRQALNPSVMDRPNKSEIQIDERSLVDYKGKYN